MSESVYIYLPPGLSLGRDELEDAIDDFLAGRGEVTGSGSGVTGSSIDIEVFDDEMNEVLDGLVGVLKTLNVPPGSRLVRPGKGTEQNIG